jgi:glutathione reductase (NADPH)
MRYDYDLFVIGAGSGGIATARRAAEYGASVGIAESDRLGGTCVNRGCVPKKLMVYASRFPEAFTDAEGYGWSPVEQQFDWDAMLTAVNAEVDRLNGIYQRMLDQSNIEILRGEARFLDPHTLTICNPEGDSQTVTADKILIAVGAYPVRPHILGIEHAITSDDIFHLKSQPKRMVILGGGYIGCEFASILNALGTDVTQVVRSDEILRGFDQDIRTSIHEGMEQHGVRIISRAELIAIEKLDSHLQVTVRTTDQQETIVVDAVSLAALGRKPKIQNLGLEHTGVKCHDGAIQVDRDSRTAEANIYAVGDCTDHVNLTPVAIQAGRALADTVFGGRSRVMSYDTIPSAIFTTPEAATVGLSEAEAIQTYGEEAIRIYRTRFRPMYYTLAKKEERTMMKLVVHKDSDLVLGAHMVGDQAAEIIQGIAIAVKMGATKADFDATVAVHPSAAEEFVTMR